MYFLQPLNNNNTQVCPSVQLKPLYKGARDHSPHFTGRETKAGGEITCPRSPRRPGTGWAPRSSDFQSSALLARPQRSEMMGQSSEERHRTPGSWFLFWVIVWARSSHFTTLCTGNGGDLQWEGGWLHWCLYSAQKTLDESRCTRAVVVASWTIQGRKWKIATVLKGLVGPGGILKDFCTAKFGPLSLYGVSYWIIKTHKCTNLHKTGRQNCLVA